MRTRLVGFVLAAAAIGHPPAAARLDAQAMPRSPENASYRLQARLDPAHHAIAGSGRLTWRNTSHAPATELRFHLYWNAWRNSASTWMRENALSGAVHAPVDPGDWSSIDLSTLALAGGGDLLPRAHFIAPDDGNSQDRTVLAVPLDRPVPPGGTIQVDVAWTAHVPRTFARTGVLGNYYFIGQWFPKVGVLEDDGWNCHQFHAGTEFFADFGSYDVSLTVPNGWIVGATGIEQSSAAANPGETTHRFVEHDVHDFAWTTSPDFVDEHAAFDVPGLPHVDIRLLLQPEHAEQADRHVDATRAALREYGRWFGPYPYGHLTVVDPVTIFNSAAQGGSTGGMEYPTLFTAGARWFAPWSGATPEDVIIHEAGHQFWYGIVATNEFEHAWMDEGINSYAEARAIADAFPNRFVTVGRYFGGLAAWPYDDVRWSREIDGDRLNGYRPFATFDTPATPTWQAWPGAIGAITYDKTALWLDTLERYLGWPTMQKVMAAYFARGAFRHPGPDEFFAIASEVSGQDLTWFFDAVYRSAAVFDYAVSSVTTVPSAPRGLVGDGPAAHVSAGGGGRLDSTVVVRRLGDGIFPLDVRVTFDDDAIVTEHWDGSDRWRAFRYRRAAPVRTVEVDPAHVLLLDVNYTNNSWTAHPQTSAAVRKWTLRWLTWAQELMLTYSFFS